MSENKKDAVFAAVVDESNISVEESSCTQTGRLLKLAKDDELFHTPDGEAYVRFQKDGHHEVWKVKSRIYRLRLLRLYADKNSGVPPSSKSTSEAIDILEATALINGEREPVFLRLARFNGGIYVDACDKEWGVYEITKKGWNYLTKSPVKFRRTKNMLELPVPHVDVDPSKEITRLWKYLNVQTNQQRQTLTGFLLNAFNPNGPFLVLVLYGEQGSSKSTIVRVIRSLVDPNTVPLRREPKNSDDLLVSAGGNWIIAIDNMSYLPDWLSDDFCRLATGGGLSKRKHYSDDEEFVLDAKRPIILNGISEFVARGDLANRAVTLHLPSIDGTQRRQEKAFWSEFKVDAPYIFSALLGSLVEALKSEGTFTLPSVPRMADPIYFASAGETALGWKRGSIAVAFEENQKVANDIVLQSSNIYPYLEKLAEKGWSGEPTGLYNALKSMNEADNPYDRNWPKSAKALTDTIRRIAPALKNAGIEINEGKTSGSNSRRQISICKTSRTPNGFDASVATAGCQTKVNFGVVCDEQPGCEEEFENFDEDFGSDDFSGGV